MTIMRRHSVHKFVIALVTAVVVAGTAFAVAQVTRNVAATVNVQVVAPDGVEIYLDAALTQVATSIGFGTVEVDPFGTSRGLVPVSVWIQNQSLTAVTLTLGDDFADADVVLEGVTQPPVLQPNEVLPGALTLDFHPGATNGITAFTVSFHADGPVPEPVFGGTLRIATADSIQSFDPLWTTARATSDVSSTILEALFDSTHDRGNGPVLLDTWTSSPDGLTWTFKIRDGVSLIPS